MTLSAPPEGRLPPDVHRSLGLNALLDAVRVGHDYTVLDLGPALEENVRFWSQISCRLYILDLYRSCQEQKAAAAPGGDFLERALDAALPVGDEMAFDFILAWDLFNYFHPQELEALVRRLNRRCSPGARLLAMISSQPELPASPRLFRILNRQQVTCETPTRATRPCPRYAPRDIIRLMARFTVSSSFLLHRGVWEYVFEFSSPAV